MIRSQFDHTIRAAGAILATDIVVVIGSQAIHGSIDAEIPEAERSIEVDICALDDLDGAKADLIDGSIGELSIFQETFGYYAQGVTPNTAVLPSGWRDRLVTYESPATNGVKALCLEIHDLWLSKAIANREKDRDFCATLLDRELVDRETLLARVDMVKDLDPAVKQRLSQVIQSAIATPGGQTETELLLPVERMVLDKYGHPEGEAKLGAMYLNGEGVPKDFGKAEFWLGMAAEDGDAEAQFNLGTMYRDGKIPNFRGDTADHLALAKDWWREAAKRGHTKAQEKLASLNARADI